MRDKRSVGQAHLSQLRPAGESGCAAGARGARIESALSRSPRRHGRSFRAAPIEPPRRRAPQPGTLAVIRPAFDRSTTNKARTRGANRSPQTASGATTLSNGQGRLTTGLAARPVLNQPRFVLQRIELRAIATCVGLSPEGLNWEYSNFQLALVGRRANGVETLIRLSKTLTRDEVFNRRGNALPYLAVLRRLGQVDGLREIPPGRGALWWAFTFGA